MTQTSTQRVASRALAAKRLNGVTYATLMQALEVSYAGVYRRLHGKRAWSTEELDAAAPVLGVTVEQLMGFEPMDGAA